MSLKYITCLIFAICHTSWTTIAQSNQSTELSHYLAQCENLLQNDGKWFAKNKKYDSLDEWSSNYLVMNIQKE